MEFPAFISKLILPYSKSLSVDKIIVSWYLQQYMVSVRKQYLIYGVLGTSVITFHERRL